jgi:mannose-6-phosphate isomerase-like protein (cupin superfamily)
MLDIASRIVRYGDLRPCRTAFIDAHTPGSDQKENFSIIGAGVSESADQHVHIRATPGFNIGAAGQPPKCRNSLHAHRTAEVFFVLKGRWRFFWGRWGRAGDVVLEEGDIFNIPTGIFRGFENVGTDYGMIMSILGGDDAGVLGVAGLKPGDHGRQVLGAAVLRQQAQEVRGGLLELGLGGDGDQTLGLIGRGDDGRCGQATQVGAFGPGRLQRLQVGADGVQAAGFQRQVEQRLCVAIADFRRSEIISH